MSNPEELNHEVETNHIDELWLETRRSQIIIDLKAGFSFQDIVNRQNIAKPISRPDHVECSDGRCPHHGDEKSLAGSGILLSDEEFESWVKNNPDIKTLTSHDDCGASKLAFADYEKNNKLPDGVTNPAQLAAWWTKTKAEKYGLEYKHISVADFSDKLHHEAGLLVDATGNFSPSFINGMPNVFISQAASDLSEDYVKNEISTLTSIAFSDHGFGSRLTESDPFYIFICAKNQANKEKLTSLVKLALDKYGKKIAIESFTL